MRHRLRLGARQQTIADEAPGDEGCKGKDISTRDLWRIASLQNWSNQGPCTPDHLSHLGLVVLVHKNSTETA